jgi:hypothetical protein
MVNRKELFQHFCTEEHFSYSIKKSGRNTYPMDIPNWEVSIQAKKKSSKFGDALIS